MGHVNYRQLILMHLGVAYAFGFPNGSVAEPTQPLYHSVQEAESVERLPRYVKAKDGELTLFADYNDVREDRIVLYLVNRTDRRIDFATEDDDVHVKLEALHESGRWGRAQPVHHYIGCGNSYYTRTLDPGEFFRFLGYQPTDGEPATIRYRMYTESVHLVSNAGPGRVQSADIIAARRDRVALRFGSFDIVRDLALGTVSGTWLGASRFQAVEALRRFPVKASAPVLMELIDDAERRVRDEAIKSLGIMGTQFPPAEMRFKELLTDKNLDLRAAAIQALSHRTMNPDVIRFTMSLLKETDPRIRGAALAVLGKSCGEFPGVHAMLVEYGKDPHPELQRLLENIQQRKLGWCQLRDVKANGGS